MVKMVRDVMSRNVMGCTPETTVREAARRMAEHKVNALVVLEEASGELEGLVSRSDLAKVYDQDHESVVVELSLIHISEPTRPPSTSRMPSSA